jgi:hypothetical protein
MPANCPLSFPLLCFADDEIVQSIHYMDYELMTNTCGGTWHHYQPPLHYWIVIGVVVGKSMAWVSDSADFELHTYKDFIAILKTYTYQPSSLAYMLVYFNVHFCILISSIC